MRSGERMKPKVEEWMREAAKVIVDANADRGRTYDNSPNGEEVAQIIAEHAPESQWVSAKERLPDNGQVCIVVIGGVVQHPTARFYLDDCWEWVGDDCSDSVPIEKVTHWMPLPEAPEANRCPK